MIVYKFGGSVIKNSEGVNRLTEIIKDCTDEDLVVVVSAFGKTTNNLEKLTEYYFNNDEEGFNNILNVIKKFHFEIIYDLQFEEENEILNEISSIFNQLSDLINHKPTNNYDFEYDQIVSLGEILSTKIISVYLSKLNILNHFIDARTCLKSGNTYREAIIDWELTNKLVKEKFNFSNNSKNKDKRTYLTQGFIASNKDNFSTTLGREGSDFTAAILANILNAKKVIIWKDVRGVLNADPSIFKVTEKLDKISYNEAIEMSFYGAKVIHPKTIKPIQNKNIPLIVKSLYYPNEKGTEISNIEGNIDYIPLFIIKEDQQLISFFPKDFSFMIEHCLSRIFNSLSKHNIKVNLIQNSAISFSVCVNKNGNKIKNVIEELKGEYNILYNENLELRTLRHYTEKSINSFIKNIDVLVEQRSRNTAHFVVRANK